MKHGKLKLAGQQFGRLKVIEEIYPKPSGSKTGSLWKCICECGKECNIYGHRMSRGRVKSCGNHPWQWTDEGKKRLSKARSLPAGRAARNAVLSVYKTGAKKWGREWSLDDAQFDALVKGRCHYCDGDLSNVYSFDKRKHFRNEPTSFPYNGIDRINSDLGYIPGNVVSCCKICNRAKSDLPLDEFLSWAKKLLRKQEAA